MNKSFVIAGLALFSSVASAQLPEYPESDVVARLNPSLTDVYLGDHFHWENPQAFPHRLKREEVRNQVLTSCTVVEMKNSDPSTLGIGPTALFIDRFDEYYSSDWQVTFYLQPYGQEDETEFEVFCMKVQMVNGQPDYSAGLPFTVGDFKRLFPRGRQRTGFFRLPFPRDS